MLIKFTTDNYRGFSKPISLDFRDTHDYKFNSQCVRDGVLNKIVIFGRNGSGKSNLGFALFDIVGLLTDKTIAPQQVDAQSFINGDSGKKEAYFEYVFKRENDEITFRYKKIAPTILSYEELFINEKKIYSYDFTINKADLANMDLIDAPNLTLDYYERTLPLLRHVANNTSQKEGSVVKYIMNFVSHMLWFRSLQENGYIGLKTGIEIINQWIIQHNLVKEYELFLKKIAGINMDLDVAIPRDNQISIPMKYIVDKHKNSILLYDSIKSSGTKALELLFYWSQSFKDVTFLFMDEFDAFYHFELARNVINYVVSFDEIQTIFTTHNSYLASNEVLRPDCYYNLVNGSLKSFADSTNREIREGHNLEKMLRNGEFDGQ